MSVLSQRNLAGGELAPALYGRVDTVKYQTGVKTAKNFFISKSGGLMNRPGTKFVCEVKDSSTVVRLIPFIFNNDQTYILEFGDDYMRVIKDAAQVLSSTSKNITGISTASEAVVTSVAHGFANGDEVYIAGVVGMTEVNGGNYIVSNKTDDTFKIKYLDGTYVDSSAFTAYSSGGTATEIYEIDSPFSDDDLDNIQYAQSGDIIAMVDGTVFPQQVARSGDAAWTIGQMSLDPAISVVTDIVFNDGSSGSQNYDYQYRVTAVREDTYEEGYYGESSVIPSAYEPTASQPHVLSWTAVTGASYYNIYVVKSGRVGFIGSSTTNAFENAGITPDYSGTPPEFNTYFENVEDADDPGEEFNDDYITPGVVSYAQQRLFFGDNAYTEGGTYQPEEVWASRLGKLSNFTVNVPIQSDSAIRFRMTGRQVNQIRHILDLNKIMIFTTGGEFTVEGGASGVITPTDINVRQYSYNGASKLAPIVVDSNAIYVQERGSIVRDLGFDYQVDGYRGNDLTVFSTHLFEGKEIVSWAYQKTPNSIIWAVRDDGVLLSMTYVREHQIWGWTRHEFDGLVERVSVIPEGNEDSVYLVIKRTIDGRSVRYIEKMMTRFVEEDHPEDMVFMDASLSYDGRNTTATTLKFQIVSGGWTPYETVALVASTSYFVASDVNRKYFLYGSDGSLVIFSPDSYQGTDTLWGKVDRDVPAVLQNITTTTWTRAVQTLSGLRHIEGESVSVLADGFVVANPNDANVDMVTVTDGAVTLDDHYGVIHIGLPYICDIETLAIDNPGGESMVDESKLIGEVYLQVEKTRGGYVGVEPPSNDVTDPVEGLMEIKVRDQEDYDSPVELRSGLVDVVTSTRWTDNGRVFIRQIDPLPMNVCSIHPIGEIPFK